MIDAKAAAVELQGCVRAAELEAAIVDRGGHHALVEDIDAGIAESCLNGVGTIPLLEDVFIGEHLHMARLIGFHGPVHDVDPVGEEVGHGAATKIPEPPPAVELFFADGLIGSAAEPLLPIKDLGIDRSGGHENMIVLPPIGSDLGYAPQASSLNEIDGIAKVAPAALLHAALQDLLAGADCPAEGGAFLNGVGDRFFKIDVFACCQGVDRHAHMPVVGRGDNDGIDRLLEDCAIIHMGGCDAIGT